MSRKNIPNHASKKNLFVKKERKGSLTLMTVLSLAAVLVILAGVYYFTRSGTPEIAAASVDRVVYPVQLFEDGKAKHFEFKTKEGLVIKYFILKSSDGVVRAAFDACDVCWPEGKGYHQEGDNMVCNNCGRRFASVQVNEVRGGCNPAPLARRVENGNLIIEAKDIQAGKSYFDFSKRG